MPPVDLTFNFIGVTAVDWAAAFRYFHETLGIRAERRAEFGDWAVFGGGWDAYYQGGSRSAIFELFDDGRTVPTRHWGLNQGIRPGFHVPDVAAVIETLQARSVFTIGAISHRPWGKAAELTGPEDIRFGLAHIPGQPSSTDLTLPYVGHVAIKCADLSAMNHFYGATLGLNLTDSGPDYAVYDQRDGHPLVILEAGGQASPFDPRGTHWEDDPVRAYPVFMSMMTPDVRAVDAYLREREVRVLRGVVAHADWGGTDLHIADPDGNPIQIVQYA